MIIAETWHGWDVIASISSAAGAIAACVATFASWNTVRDAVKLERIRRTWQHYDLLIMSPLTAGLRRFALTVREKATEGIRQLEGLPVGQATHVQVTEVLRRILEECERDFYALLAEVGTGAEALGNRELGQALREELEALQDAYTAEIERLASYPIELKIDVVLKKHVGRTLRKAREYDPAPEA